MDNGEKPKRDLRELPFKFTWQVIKLDVSANRSVLAPTLGRQMLRAGTSVGANFREADQARSKAAFAAPIGDGLKEADETAYWLEPMAAEKVGVPADVAAALAEANQLVAILTTIKRRAGSKE